MQEQQAREQGGGGLRAAADAVQLAELRDEDAVGGGFGEGGDGEERDRREAAAEPG